MSLPTPSTPLTSLRGLAASPACATAGETPQWYRADALRAADGHPLLHALVEACRQRWGRDDLMLESQVVDLRPGTAPGIPVWHRLPASSTGEVALACLAQEALLELADEPADATESSAACRGRLGDTAGEPLPGDHLCFLAAGAALRFRRATLEQLCVVVLIRPRDGLRLFERRRHCARVFVAAPTAAPAGTLPAWADERVLPFTTGFSVIAPMPTFTQQQIADEPLMAGASPQYVRANGGPIAQAWLDRVPEPWRGDDVIIQIKRDELSPGWWPAVLAWHLDGTSRAEKRADGTPDLRKPVRMQDQVAACMGPASPTALLTGSIVMPEIPLGTPQPDGGQVWQRIVLDAIANGQLQAGTAPCDTVFSFGWGAFHACSRAKVPGWRLFLKAMRGRGDVPQNRRPARATVAWAYDRGDWPDDPCGVFPQDLPF